MLPQKYKNFLGLNIYQIYPRSFMDTDGDGIGNLKGITEKLDYLRELNVNAVWLCPCYKTENRDNGYDISDYRDINPEYGTLDDIKELIAEMHKRDMKLIMDLVPNHTSSMHKWFLESKKSKDNKYSDYYYWFDEKPNDWQSVFGGSAWEYCEERKQYYLHSYDVTQPDLNWDNPLVRKEICDIIDYWADMGIDGFRIDVIDQISKDVENDEFFFGPNLHKYIKEMFGREGLQNIFTVGECWASTIEEICMHCKYERKELSTLFQFDHLDCGRGNDKFTPQKDSLKSLRNTLVKWQKLTAENDILYSLFTDNHDNAPFISRIGNDTNLRYESATCIAAMTYLLKGVAFIYQGQEFGTTAAHYDSIEYFDDVESKNFYDIFIRDGISKEEALRKINFGSRDNARHPMCWDNSENFGFSKGEPWIVPHSRGKEINLANDYNSDRSIFKFYKELLYMRTNENAVMFGDLNIISSEEDNYFAFSRNCNNEKIVAVCNFEKENTIELPDILDKTPVLANYSENSSFVFKPYEVRIYKFK